MIWAHERGQKDSNLRASYRLWFSRPAHSSALPCPLATATLYGTLRPCGLRLSARFGFASACQHARLALACQHGAFGFAWRLVRKSSWGVAMSIGPYRRWQRFVARRRARPEPKRLKARPKA